jgi:hypothetical protein
MSAQKKHISDVRDALFKVLDGLTDKDNPMDLDRARAVNETAQVIINSAKVEVDFLKVMQGDGEVPFIQTPALPAPIPQQSPLPTAADAEDSSDASTATPRPWRSTVHKLKG